MNALISAREAVVAARNDAGYARQMAEGLAEVLNVSLAAMSSFRIFKAGNTLCQTGGHLRANHGSIYLLQPMKCQRNHLPEERLPISGRKFRIP
ncbi:hypothetical protein [Slackia isoflavoniconvertens]|uniref:hypothetical protein n=1 Tax=Slackia isoflavoniconvertens TaxID=572010 RepID=UPI003A8D1EE6